MFGLHRHQYVEIERFYQPGMRLTESKWASVDEVKRLSAGVTTIHSQCSVCGKERFKEVYGKAENAT